MQKYSVIGQRVPRIDGPEKATGRAVYGVDVRLPQMLAGRILRSPYAHARILRIDTSRAERVDGVKAVITAEDTPRIPFSFVKIHNPAFADCLPLQDEKVRFIGDEVAAVAAVDQDAALEAIDLIKVEYEELPAVFDPEEARQLGAPLVHEEVGGNVFDRVHLEAGDVPAALAAADVVFEQTYSTSPASPVTMEPQQAVASWDPSGRLTVWASIQMPFLLRRDLADTLGLSEGQVRVVRTTVGGGFGKRMEMHAPDPIAAVLAKKAGRPVKIVYSREEEFVATRFRHPLRLRVRLGARRDGTITALHIQGLTDAGAYCTQAPGVTRVAGGNALTLYRVPNVLFEAENVYTNNPPAGSFRGYGNPQGNFALESAIDGLAAELNLDPVELRLRNCNRSNTPTVLEQFISSCGQAECIRAAAERIRAPSPPRPLSHPGERGEGEPFPFSHPGERGEGGEGPPTRRRGIGLATAVNVGGGARDLGNSDGCGAIVKLEDDGSAVVITGGQEIGSGGSTMMAQIAAEELGLPLSHVRIVNDDTDVIPWDVGCHAQRNTFIAGNAVRLAAREARVQLLQRAAELLGAAPDDLDLHQGRLQVRGVPERSVAVSEVVVRAHFNNPSEIVLGQAFFDPSTVPTDPRGRGQKSATYSFSAQAAEVEVDTDTGQVRVLRMVCAQDVGRAINPMDVEGQIHGGIIQGLGWALGEHLIWQQGRIVNPSLADYKVFHAPDAPPIETLLIETEDPEGPYGAKGVAEIAIVPTAAAVANAVCDAIGVRITDLPLTPEKVLGALARHQAGGAGTARVESAKPAPAAQQETP